jgi:hypothetical protein
MKPYALTLILFFLIASPSFAQTPDAAKTNGKTSSETSTIPAPPAITANSTPLELARSALAAMGGDKFKNLKSTMLVGSASLYGPGMASSIPGTFMMVTAGDKVRIDINAQPIFMFKQVYDGRRSFSSIPGVDVPPASKFGLPLLAKFEQTGYTVSALPDKKKLRAFRIVDSEGNTTDFYIDPATARISEYVIPYNGSTFGASISKFKEFEGVLFPVNFSQRFEMTQGAYFAEYKVKDIRLNQPIGDDVFAIQ